MVENDVKRSSGAVMRSEGGLDEGVGGRQGSKPSLPDGGGYSVNCTKLQAPLGGARGGEDPRLVELKKMGLGYRWVNVAYVLGFDAFLLFWEAIDAEIASSDLTDRRVHVPLFSTFSRFQRNQLIKSLSAEGLSVKEIREKVRDSLGESVREITIRRHIK